MSDDHDWAEVVSWLHAAAEYAAMLKPGSYSVPDHPLAVRSWVEAGETKYLALLRGTSGTARRLGPRHNSSGTTNRGAGAYLTLCARCDRVTRHYSANGNCVECNKTRETRRRAAEASAHDTADT